MEKRLRAILLKWLGAERYLGLVSDVYIRLIRAGLMKKKYPELFYLQQIIRPDFVCVDIGANVGYYSTFLSLLAGPGGHIFAVEPVPLFARVLQRNIGRFARPNLTLYQTALGSGNAKIRMETPLIAGVFRHGLTRVTDSPANETGISYEVEMQVPDQLFSSLGRFDFLKCDVEGYEVNIIPHFLQTLRKFMPLIQIELNGKESRKEIFSLLQPLGYEICMLDKGGLKSLDPQEALQYEDGDFYFKPKSDR